MNLLSRVLLAALFVAPPALAQTTNDPYPDPIPAAEGAIAVGYTEFATIPDRNGQAPRLMLLLDEPGTRRMFVNDMQGPLYSVSYDGKTVQLYVDLSDPKWGVDVQAGGRERGVQSFAFHPQFSQAGAPGFGKFYTLTDTANLDPPPDFRPTGGNSNSHDTILLEWSARTPSAASYDGGTPRELMRFEQPFSNHNGGHLTFNPIARPGDADYGLLYMGMADGGSGGDPLGHAQNLVAGFGKIMRIDPLGRNGKNGKYGIPASNPFVNREGALGEIYAYGLRNPQRFAWDSKNGNMFVADIGQDAVEEVSLVTPGANLGWNKWEGSYRYAGRSGVRTTDHRSEPGITYPVVEYGQTDPLLQSRAAATLCCVYRGTEIPKLSGLLLFGDNPSGEIFYVSADNLPNGDQGAIRRIVFNDEGTTKTLLQLIQ